jgi:RNA polymerase sigma-70 factor (ECF subfamily)
MAEERRADTGDSNVGPVPLRIDIRSLVQEHHQDVYRYAYRLAGKEVDAEDLTQQTFLIAQQRLHQIRQPERVIGWLFTILRSCYLKTKRKFEPLSASSLELEIDSIPDEPIEETFDKEALQAALDKLPDDFKLVVVMFYFEQCSYKQIAEQLEIPIGTVMSRLTRAKSRLRACLFETSNHRKASHRKGRRGISS